MASASLHSSASKKHLGLDFHGPLCFALMFVLLITAVCVVTFYCTCMGKKLKISADRFNENALDFENQRNR